MLDQLTILYGDRNNIQSRMATLNYHKHMIINQYCRYILCYRYINVIFLFKIMPEKLVE
jgi:hypothetical protein